MRSGVATRPTINAVLAVSRTGGGGTPLAKAIDAAARLALAIRSKGQLPTIGLMTDGRANVMDGLRVDWPDRWFHVRVSQTEPVVRVICEQKGEAPRALFDGLMDKVRSYA